jgi:uncharacterized membrane protein YoaK (UPF0700 family)
VPRFGFADSLEVPFNYSRRLTGSRRTAAGDRHLGFTLAFVAGATNAGGFLAVQQYTSHMTGIVSSMADNVVLRVPELVIGGVGALVSFVAGAACSAVMVNYARRRQLESEFAFPLLLEAILLSCFGILGAQLDRIEGLFVPATVMLLCFIMGLQNAVITKLSHAEIRTTHVTGVITDIGIELGKLCYWNRTLQAAGGNVVGDRRRLMIFCAPSCPASLQAELRARSASSTWATSRRCLWRWCWCSWRRYPPPTMSLDGSAGDWARVHDLAVLVCQRTYVS